MENEEWRDIPGYEGKYQISISTKEGRCRIIDYNRTGKTKVSVATPDKEGRLYWHLSLNGTDNNQQAAVWIAFTYPELVQNEYFEGAQIDHIDTDPLNNHPSNLRWVTPKENCNNPLTKQHMSEAMKGENAYWYGKNLPEDTRNKISKALYKYYDEHPKPSGEAHFFYGKKHTEETKKKMSEAAKGKKKPWLSKHVRQYSLNGDYIATYSSTQEAVKQNQNLKLSHVCICLCCKGRRKTHKGYIWKYAE